MSPSATSAGGVGKCKMCQRQQNKTMKWTHCKHKTYAQRKTICSAAKRTHGLQESTGCTSTSTIPLYTHIYGQGRLFWYLNGCDCSAAKVGNSFSTAGEEKYAEPDRSFLRRRENCIEKLVLAFSGKWVSLPPATELLSKPFRWCTDKYMEMHSDAAYGTECPGCVGRVGWLLFLMLTPGRIVWSIFCCRKSRWAGMLKGGIGNDVKDQVVVKFIVFRWFIIPPWRIVIFQ